LGGNLKNCVNLFWHLRGDLKKPRQFVLDFGADVKFSVKKVWAASAKRGQKRSKRPQNRPVVITRGAVCARQIMAEFKGKDGCNHGHVKKFSPLGFCNKKESNEGWLGRFDGIFRSKKTGMIKALR
jgi:hypothetical protein